MSRAPHPGLRRLFALGGAAGRVAGSLAHGWPALERLAREPAGGTGALLRDDTLDALAQPPDLAGLFERVLAPERGPRPDGGEAVGETARAARRARPAAYGAAGVGGVAPGGAGPAAADGAGAGRRGEAGGSAGSGGVRAPGRRPARVPQPASSAGADAAAWRRVSAGPAALEAGAGGVAASPSAGRAPAGPTARLRPPGGAAQDAGAGRRQGGRPPLPGDGGLRRLALRAGAPAAADTPLPARPAAEPGVEALLARAGGARAAGPEPSGAGAPHRDWAGAVRPAQDAAAAAGGSGRLLARALERLRPAGSGRTGIPAAARRQKPAGGVEGLPGSGAAWPRVQPLDGGAAATGSGLRRLLARHGSPSPEPMAALRPPASVPPATRPGGVVETRLRDADLSESLDRLLRREARRQGIDLEELSG